MSPANFKAIVVGGGPVGLIAAHALTRANIDFVVLESRPSIVIHVGASLALSPMGLRVIGQLGLLDALYQVSTPLGQMERCDHNGNDLGIFHVFNYIKENHGDYSRVISRHDLTKTLYDGLPQESQARMLPNKKVSELSSTPEGVIVHCADGTSYEGSIIIGADGAHSNVRQRMRLLAMEAGAPTNAEKPYLTTYRALWVRFPTELGLRPGQVHETHGEKLGLQCFAGNETAVLALYEQLPKPARERSRYTKADEEAFAKRWEHLPITTGVTVRQAYDAQLFTGITDLEEGVVEYWSWDRMVLVGDAAHKFTPSTGAGCNNGIADVVVLVNELHKIMKSQGGAHKSVSTMPTINEITNAFKAYQEARHEPVTAGCKQSGGATAMATWQNTTVKFLDKYIISSQIVQKLLFDRAASNMAKSPVFDFIHGTEPMVGRVPWVQPIKPSA
ncbi:FAD binding domain-containing protein [Seiridium cupressi]